MESSFAPRKKRKRHMQLSSLCRIMRSGIRALFQAVFYVCVYNTISGPSKPQLNVHTHKTIIANVWHWSGSAQRVCQQGSIRHYSSAGVLQPSLQQSTVSRSYSIWPLGDSSRTMRTYQGHPALKALFLIGANILEQFHSHNFQSPQKRHAQLQE